VARSSKLNLSWRSIVRKSISKKLISIFPKLYFSQSCKGGSMAQKLWLQVLQSKLHIDQRTEQSELLISKPQLGLFVSTAFGNSSNIEPLQWALCFSAQIDQAKESLCQANQDLDRNCGDLPAAVIMRTFIEPFIRENICSKRKMVLISKGRALRWACLVKMPWNRQSTRVADLQAHVVLQGCVIAIALTHGTLTPC
jgi:hypothetical protein